MRKFGCRLSFPGKVAVSLLVVGLFIILQDKTFPHLTHLPVKGSTFLSVVLSPSPKCPGGFYTKEELKPPLQRPIQDLGAPGENGKPFVLYHMSLKEIKEKLNGFKKNQFNQFASDRISLHRDLGKDTRHPDCLAQKFWRCPGLPTTSVIIVFHNEAWSTLLRTVYSVLHTAPAALLKEILLVDDASTDGVYLHIRMNPNELTDGGGAHLKTPLDNYVRELKIVRVLRQKTRKGLIAARLLGTRAARGEVLTFLDSHCECFPGWLEPLLARIVEEPTAVVSPKITNIDKNNLKFNKPIPRPHIYTRGNFNWKLRFGWELLPEEQKKQRRNETYPIRTPTFAGGLFSISKSYFEHLGLYDDQMEFWGGENLEMSFRVWQCGGQLEIIPCSVVGHIFRTRSPHTYPNGKAVIARNLVRLAEVWMDDYKWVFYRRLRKAGSIFELNLFGDVTKRRELRERLKCKNFSWYLKNIYPEVYVPDIKPVMHGKLENTHWSCSLDVENTKKPVQHVRCSTKDQVQYFEYTSVKEIRLSSGTEMCLHATPGKILVTLERCHLKGKLTRTAPEQVWIFTQDNQLRNLSTGKCLSVSEENVIITSCISTRLSQHWLFI